MSVAETASASAAPTTTRKRISGRVEQSLAAEEAAARVLALKGRTISLVAVAVLLFILVPFPEVLFYEVLLLLFIAAGFARMGLERLGLFRWWQPYAQTSFDFALLAFTLVVPNPRAHMELPAQMNLRGDNFVYFYVMLIGHAFTYRPRQVVWAGAMGALSWIVAVIWVISQPGTIFAPPAAHTLVDMIAVLGEPTFVDLDMVLQDVAVFLIVAGLLAIVVARSRDLVERHAALERDRSNLARYFPMATVDRLAKQDAALAQVREQEVAVLFADLVGFTRWSERHSPREVIAVLREVHARFEEAVFRYGGTLDKFIGDGMMATFGTPDPGERDASNALACLIAILVEMEAWNARRQRAGEEPINVSIGLHYGPVVLGNIGTDRRLEFSVLGDTVNVASRLEALTRELRCKAAISGDLATAVMIEAAGEGSHPLASFRERGPQILKGRDEPVQVLSYG